MDDMYAVDGQRHAWAGHSCGAVQDKALKFFPYASPSGKAEGSADLKKYSITDFFSFWYDLGFGGSLFLFKIYFKKYSKIVFSSFWHDLGFGGGFFLFNI